jgi:hypothetical protein
MPKLPLRAFAAALLLLLAIGSGEAAAGKLKTLETPRFRMMYEKRHEALAGEILQIAESVWPTLAKAYESYEHYERIDILILDESDDANGFAIYPWSQVAIFAPHMDLVLRNRQIWLRNVVTHELAHVFTLRRAARLSPFDWVDVSGHTYSARDRINYSFSIPWVPLIAPNWYIEGIAQFEAEANGNDEYDSQREMLLRDAWLTGTLPTLDYIETFEPTEPWIQGERVYNTGYAFLRWLRDRYGAEKVRRLAFAKPLFNFSHSVEAAFGQGLPELFEAFKKSLDEKYAPFKELPKDPLADPAMPGTYQQNLVFSPDGKYMAWLGNDDKRRFPANWIYWKRAGGGGEIRKSEAPVTPPPASAPEVLEPAPDPDPKPEEPAPEGLAHARARSAAIPGLAMFGSPNPVLDLGRRHAAPGGRARRSLSPSRTVERIHRLDRSKEFGSEGLEFNREGTRLLTARQDREHSRYTDLWEYEFLADKPEDGKWRRLTWEERASYPSYHPVQRKIVYVRKDAGSTNIAVLDSAGRIGQLTRFTRGEQVYNPRFTPRGDSIYFTLQVEDREAIAVIAADATPFDQFAALQDSAAFPDSVNFARDERILLATPLRRGAIRNLRFQGDTLLWSSNMVGEGPSVYDVYARLPGDPAIHRATQARTQALEPVVHGGDLYYQGYQRQRFLIFKRPLVLTATGESMLAVPDTIGPAKPKRIKYARALELGSYDIETGEYGSPRIAHDIVPFLSVTPQFIDNDRSYTDIALGLTLNVGDALGNWAQGFSAAVAKRADRETPLNYQLAYAGFLSFAPIRHTRLTWTPALSYSLYHDIYSAEDDLRDRGGFREGIDTVSYARRQRYSTEATRDIVNAYLPLPYNFHLDGSFFRQLISQDFSEDLVFTVENTGEVIPQNTPKTSILENAPQHRHFSTGLNWGYTWPMLGTYLPTAAGVWISGRKWWSTYQSGFLVADTLLKQTLSQEGKASPEFVLLQSDFNPWSIDLGAGGVWSYGKAFSVFANARGGLFLNKFPTEETVANIDGTDTLRREETVNTLWAMTYQLGYSLMPGYPYNFRYRGRDIMEGTSIGRLQAGVDIPIPLGAFIPALPTSSFRQLSLTAVGNMGSTLIVPADRIYRTLEKGRHNLLVDFGLRLAANFRLYHRIPFTLYAQGFMPWNKLEADDLFTEDYGRTPPRVVGMTDSGSPVYETPAQNDDRDRENHIRLVKEPRFFVGFQVGY